MPGILHVPSFVRALLVETMVHAVPDESVLREAELDELLVAEGKEADEIAGAFVALWDTDPAPSPVIELEHFYSKKTHLHGARAANVGRALYDRLPEAGHRNSPRPNLQLSKDTSYLWRRALQHLLANAPEDVESWKLVTTSRYVRDLRQSRSKSPTLHCVGF